MSFSLITTEPRKRFIIKISYPKKHASSLIDDSMDDHSQGSACKRRKVEGHAKPIVTGYWLDSTITLSQHKRNNVVDTNRNNKKEHSNTTTVSPADCLHSKKSFGKENLKVFPIESKDDVGCKKNENLGNDTSTPSSVKDGLKKNGGGEELMMNKEKKTPMERYKRLQCWAIVNRMITGKDGWALKNPLDLKCLKNKSLKMSDKLKAIGLKDIEAKLKFYSIPDEFAEDMRFVFYHGWLYPQRDVVHKIAMRLSDIFENKWMSLKEEWALEDRRLNKIHKRKKIVYQKSCDSGKDHSLSKIFNDQSNILNGSPNCRGRLKNYVGDVTVRLAKGPRMEKVGGSGKGEPAKRDGTLLNIGGQPSIQNLVCKYRSNVDDLQWARNGVTTTVINGESIPVVQDRIADAGMVGIDIIPLGVDKVFIRSTSEFLATAGAIVDVKNGRIVFQVSDEMVGFELENLMKGPALYSCCMIKDHDVKECFFASSTQYDLFDPF
ncbi:bromodomain protein, putative [Medicago truncatula]|uniref:Bromodomain protein, putative n=1 Tax=Medicago truncatula TaxID=3880 RepID=A0A072TFB7_MEDTR|nr:bromodomain protein, putative [Medicago truncatula]